MPKVKNNKADSKAKVAQKKSKSKSTSMSCKDKCKKLRCSDKFGVGVQICPERLQPQFATKSGYFDVDVDVETVPRCRVTQLKPEKVSECEGKCRFRVDVCVDYKVNPTVVRTSEVPPAYFELDFSAKTKQKCLDNPDVKKN